MVAILAALVFSAAFSASVWAIYATIEPRIGYMRVLLSSSAVPGLAPAVAPRNGGVTRSVAASTMAPRSLRAAA